MGREGALASTARLNQSPLPVAPEHGTPGAQRSGGHSAYSESAAAAVGKLIIYHHEPAISSAYFGSAPL